MLTGVQILHSITGCIFLLQRLLFFKNLGPLALNYVLAAGGAGYFRMQAIQHHLEAGRLHLVPDAPRYSYPIYVVHSENTEKSVLNPALAGLRALPSVRGVER